MSVKRISLRFNLDNADDRRAWEALHRLGSRSINKEIITRINAKDQEDSLKDCIRQIISDELSKVISGGFVQQLPLVEEEEMNNVFDFLDSF